MYLLNCYIITFGKIIKNMIQVLKTPDQTIMIQYGCGDTCTVSLSGLESCINYTVAFSREKLHCTSTYTSCMLHVLCRSCSKNIDHVCFNFTTWVPHRDHYL